MNFIVKLNGIYDIACAFAILYTKNTYLDTLHSCMFLPGEMNPMALRYMAYWIFTYGCIRLYSNDKQLIAVSYLLEAVVFLNELVIHQSVYELNGLFVAIVSMILAMSLCLISS